MEATAFLPQIGLFKSTIQKQTATITGEIRKLHWLGCATGPKKKETWKTKLQAKKFPIFQDGQGWHHLGIEKPEG